MSSFLLNAIVNILFVLLSMSSTSYIYSKCLGINLIRTMIKFSNNYTLFYLLVYFFAVLCEDSSFSFASCMVDNDLLAYFYFMPCFF